MTKTIGNPLSWGAGRMWAGGIHAISVMGRLTGDGITPQPEVRRIGLADLRDSLRAGLADFAAFRSDVAFLCLFYPIIGVLMAWAAFHENLLPLLFPVASGFTLLGSTAAIGLYEMSRRREKGEHTGWTDAFAVVESPSFGAIFFLGLFMLVIFAVWLSLAGGIYAVTLGPEPPASVGAFISDVLTTGAGWAMILIGGAVGFAFAVLVLAVSVISFPLLLDRDVGLPVAIMTSVKVATTNPREIGAWGAIVGVALVLGSIPFFLGLVVVLPVLGHATWHLYRRTVAAPAAETPAK